MPGFCEGTARPPREPVGWELMVELKTLACRTRVTFFGVLRHGGIATVHSVADLVGFGPAFSQNERPGGPRARCVRLQLTMAH